MSKMSMLYEGDLQLSITHELSGVTIKTDAPPDNQGQGRSFSPTDLAASSLGACMATVMGIVAKRHAIDLNGMKVDVEKIMTSQPKRRIGELKVHCQMPAGISEEMQAMLIRAAESCPVLQSLHPDIKIDKEFVWG